MASGVDGRAGSSERAPTLLRTFEAICGEGPLERSELSWMLAASPSTITAMVHNLLRRQLIGEVGAAESRGGRPPMILDLAPDIGGVVAVAIGSLTVRVAAGDLRGRMISHHVIETAKTPKAFRSRLLRAIEEAARVIPGAVRAIALAVPGTVTPARQEISLSTKIPGWPKEHPSSWLSGWDAPVMLENEANLAALGERMVGNLADDQSVLFFSVGAGVGAGFLMNGELFRGSTGAAGDIGRTRIGLGEEPLEHELSAAGIVRRFHAAGGRRSVDSSETVAELAETGDPAAQRTMAETTELLAVALANAIAVLDPTTVVLGGGLVAAVPALIAPVRERVGELLPGVPDLVLSQLGSDASLTGAAWLAAQRARADILAELDANPMPH